MTTDIMIVSYAKDIPWLEWCLKSIRKFATGFNRVVLVAPTQEVQDFIPFKDQADLMFYSRDEDPEKWHIHHQAMKCRADDFCGGDFILHTDSDCVFTEPVSPGDYFVNDKPVMLIERYNRLRDNPWRNVVETALGFPVEYETMRRHPQVNYRGIYEDLRNHIAGVHDEIFEDWVLRQKATFPWGFTEFNTIGAFAMHDIRWRNKYHFVDLARQPRPRDKIMQFWSHDPLTKEADLPMGMKLKKTPLQVFGELGL